MKSSVRKLIKGKKKAKKDDLWLFLKDKFDIGNELRRPYEQRWLITLAFLASKQYAFYNKTNHIIQHLVTPKGRIRLTDNQMLPKYRKQISRFIRNHPKMSVIPASTDNEDIKAAKKGDKLLRWLWKNQEMRKKCRLLAGWIYGTGNGFLGDRWDPSSGPFEANSETGELEYLGDVSVEVWSPFEIGIPCSSFGEIELEDFPWITQTKWRTIEWFERKYPGKIVEPEERATNVIDTSALFGESITSPIASETEGANCIQLKLKPCKAYPKGLFLVGANGTILDKKDYPFDSYHLDHFKDVEIPGVFYGMATSEPAVALQKTWNRTLSDLAEYNRICARGKLLEPKGSQIQAVPDEGFGQRLRYNPVMGHKPEWMDLKNLPASYQQVFNLLVNSLMNLYHQHEVSDGTNKSDIRSGEMVSLLLEQDDFGNVPTHAVFEEGMERTFSRVLRRIQKGYTTERIVTITGRDGEHDVFAFTGADLRNNTDVFVTKESSLPDSKTARQFRIKENYKEGLYGNPEDPKVRERVLKMLDDVPDDVKDIFAEANQDRQIASIENRAIFETPDISIVVNNYDDHAIHVETHRMFRKEPEYQKLKFTDSDRFIYLETQFEEHLSLHNRFLEEQMKQEEVRIIRMKKLEKGGD